MEVTQLAALNASLTQNAATVDMNKISPIGGGLTDGFEGEVAAVGYVSTEIKLTNDQKINIAGVETVIPKGENAISLAISFKDGSSVALSALRRSAKSSVGGKAFRAFAYPEIQAFVGKTLKVTNVMLDQSTARNRVVTNADGTTRDVPNVGKAYTLAIS